MMLGWNLWMVFDRDEGELARLVVHADCGRTQYQIPYAAAAVGRMIGDIVVAQAGASVEKGAVHPRARPENHPQQHPCAKRFVTAQIAMGAEGMNAREHEWQPHPGMTAEPLLI